MVVQNFIKLSVVFHELKLTEDAENNTAVTSAGSKIDGLTQVWFSKLGVNQVNPVDRGLPLG